MQGADLLRPFWQRAQEDGALPSCSQGPRPHPISCSRVATSIQSSPPPTSSLTFSHCPKGPPLSSMASGSDHHQQAKARNPSLPGGGPGVREEENQSLELSGWGRERPTIWATSCTDLLGKGCLSPASKASQLGAPPAFSEARLMCSELAVGLILRLQRAASGSPSMCIRVQSGGPLCSRPWVPSQLLHGLCLQGPRSKAPWRIPASASLTALVPQFPHLQTIGMIIPHTL